MKNIDLRTQQKELAIELINKLDIYKPYIKAFKDNNTITLYEQYGGYYIEEADEQYKDIKDFEEREGCLVYAVTHEYTGFGECYDYLIIPKYKEDWEDLICYSDRTKHVIFAYVVNKDEPYCSEYGDITINQFGGGLARVA